ncbi:hypothetical protein [Anabaena sp. CCY 0017]|uniref:hypothetical protein n=1 Tax=Anabaena sp. CCY 0017 TaxID=3103866 RepID=UPI0039C5FF8F
MPSKQKTYSIRISPEDLELAKARHLEYCQLLGKVISFNEYVVTRITSDPLAHS